MIKMEIATGQRPCSILRHWEIYSRYDALKKINNSKTIAVFKISDKYHISEMSAYRIIKKMELHDCFDY